MYKKIILNNGLTIILADMPRMESVSIGVWIGVGGRYETSRQSGISHFLEHMVFKATKTRSGKEIKESIEGKGGLLNGFTGEEFTCYMAKVLSKDTSSVIGILTDMALNPKLARSDFDKERFVILEEIKMYRDMPNHYVQELLAELLWPNQPLGMPLAGTFDTIAAMSQKDLAIFRQSYYNPKNIVISIAGKLPNTDIVKTIRRCFARTKAKSKPICPPAILKQREPAVNFFHKDTEQTHIAMGLHGYSRYSKDKYDLDIMHIILGGNMSSRLFHEVRERSGLAYEISSSVKHYHDTGALVVSAGIDNKKVEKAMGLILKELKKIKGARVTKKEFQRAKEYYRGQLLMVFEDTMSHMLWLGEKFICADLEYRATDVLKRLNRVTIDDVKHAADNCIKQENLNLAVIGPTKPKTVKEIKKRLFDL